MIRYTKRALGDLVAIGITVLTVFEGHRSFEDVDEGQ